MVAMGAVVIGHENLRTRLMALEDTPPNVFRYAPTVIG